MRKLTLILLLLFTSLAVAQTIVPAASVNGVTIGSGYFESYQRQIVRTAGNIVYAAAADDNPCQTASSRGVIRMWKGSGTQSLNALVPTTFTEVDSANHPTALASGTCLTAGGGITFVVLSPDMRLVGTTIHLAYVVPSGGTAGNVVYRTFDTNTDLWGTATTIASDATAAVDGGWARGASSVITVDGSGAIIVGYATSTQIKYLKCSTTCTTAGNWTGGVIYSGTHVSHPSIVTGADNITRLAWLNNSNASPSVLYSQYNGTSWITPETVATGILSDTNDDQSPALAVDSSNRPYIMYLVGTAGSFTDNYIRVKVRTGVNTYVDDSPQVAAGAPSASGTLSTHTPQNYFTWNGDHFIFLAHDSVRNPGPYKLQLGGYNNNYGALIKVDPRDEVNTTAGTPGIDGSATIRYDPIAGRDTNPAIIDFGYYDEDDGATAQHHSTLFYKALAVNGPSTSSYANLWVDTNGGTCTRQATLQQYVDAAACASFSAAYAAASGGDIIRVKAGTYASQSAGGSKTPAPQIIAETGTVIDTGTAHHVNALSFSGSVVVDNVNVGGLAPTVGFYSGSGSTWQNSTFLASPGPTYRACGAPYNDNEPIQIYGDLATVSNSTLRNIVIEQQKGADAAGNNCKDGFGNPDVYHLEMIRIDKDVNGVLLDRVTVGKCIDGTGFVGCGSGQIFITTDQPTSPDPSNITIQNSVFLQGISYHIQTHANWTPIVNFVVAYNSFTTSEPLAVDTGIQSFTTSKFIGNLGTRPQNCYSGVTYTKNVWQWSLNTPCGTDTRVTGPNYSTSALGFDANGRLTAGSPAINAAEAAGYCTSTLGSVDRDGNARPVSTACDAGAFEYDGTGGVTNYTLTVNKSGTGTGAVSGGTISCGATCTQTAASGTSITLSATPTGSDTFTGWSGGGCSGTGTCVVTLGADTAVAATFTAAAAPPSVQHKAAGTLKLSGGVSIH